MADPTARGDSPAVILDCDPGHDDAIALLLALASPEIELVGVTTVHGNQTLEKTTDNALRVLELAGRSDVPVAAGADRPLVRDLHVAAHVHGESGLDGPALPDRASDPVEQHAVDFLVEHVTPETVLVPVGPLTNVALALDRGIRPARIVLMGGAIAEGNMTPAAEFNIWADPEAAVRVFHSGLDVSMIGLDVTHGALLTPVWAERFRAAGRVGAFVAELVEFFKRYHARTYGWDGAPIHDAVALAHAFRPGIVRTEHMNVEVETESELTRGRTVADRWHRTDRLANAHVAVEIDADAFFELLLQRISTYR
jgi:inosine-uridine nucleoside N-ribohydrolase